MINGIEYPPFNAGFTTIDRLEGKPDNHEDSKWFLNGGRRAVVRFDDHIADALRYKESFDNPENIRIDGKSIVENTGTRLTPITIDELIKKQNALSMEGAFNKMTHEIESHFENILNRRGISRKQWMRYGVLEVKGNQYNYKYKDKTIFRVVFPDLVLNKKNSGDEYKSDYTVYYMEVNDEG